MLTKLKAAHAELRAAIAVLAAETARAAPDPAALPAARLKLTRASSRRRTLVQCLIATELHGLPSETAHRVEALRRNSYDMAVLSSEHIGRWTLRAILADWAGYQQASIQIRAAMLRRMEEEMTVLYPLLEERD